jgi:hypothetical protein
MTDRVGAYLDEVRERSERPLGPEAAALAISNDAARRLLESAADVPPLLKFACAVRKEIARWDRDSSTPYGATAMCAQKIEELIEENLLGEEAR